eukprot:GAFH01004994.1.p4 GENE.GAFH01004994.1~~GAFH01004994.1.p4  ORF type:complete len:107 (+),score=16.96 GAFH01004994.1:96-416(+)
MLMGGVEEEEGAVHLQARQHQAVVPAGVGAGHQHSEAAGRECPVGDHGEGGPGIGTGGDGAAVLGVLVQGPPAGITAVHRALQPPRLQPILHIRRKITMAEGSVWA